MYYLKSTLLALLLCVVSPTTFGQNDTIKSKRPPINRGYSIGVNFTNPFYSMVPKSYRSIGGRYTKFFPSKKPLKHNESSSHEVFFGLEYANSQFWQNQSQGALIQIYDSLILIRKWENARSYLTTRIGTSLFRTGYPSTRMFNFEVFLNFAHYKEQRNYGTDYMYFDTPPSNDWFVQNAPEAIDFYGRRTTNYFVLGAGCFFRFEIPVIINSFKRDGLDPVWYFGVKGGIQNVGYRFVVRDTIDSDPKELFAPASNAGSFEYALRLSVARGFGK